MNKNKVKNEANFVDFFVQNKSKAYDVKIRNIIFFFFEILFVSGLYLCSLSLFCCCCYLSLSSYVFHILFDFLFFYKYFVRFRKFFGLKFHKIDQKKKAKEFCSVDWAKENNLCYFFSCLIIVFFSKCDANL